MPPVLSCDFGLGATICWQIKAVENPRQILTSAFFYQSCELHRLVILSVELRKQSIIDPPFPAAIMKLATSLLLPVLVGAASAATDASVYIFQGDAWPNTSKPPTLSPEQARLVFAQRMGASQYHGLEDASERTLSYINSFGGRRESLFQDSTDQRAAELILIVEGVSSKTARPLLEAWASITPAFAISNPPSLEANERLVLDLHQQSEQLGKDCAFADALNPFDAKCWNGPSKIMHFDLGDTKVNDLNKS